MRSCVPILATLALSACYVYASPLVCVIFCSRGDEFPYVRTPDHCDCSSVKSGDLIRFDHIQERAVQNNHTHHSQTTPAPSTTTDICDYLCSIQLGGRRLPLQYPRTTREEVTSVSENMMSS